MIFNIYHKYTILLICISTISVSNNLDAQIQKNIQTIEIYSSYQTIDILTDTITFTGKVTLKYKNIDLYADKILISHIKNTQLPSMIKAYGNPVTLKQIPKIGHTIFAQSLIVQYNADHHILSFIGDACIKQADNSIKAENIIYLINKKQIKAISNKNKQIISTLLIKPINQ
ncbi:lipopolysaccharide transport periplasmic protein LptA [Candidatus Blochmannia ocreatus (nom. nud.)]|uniref:Lipopolysaccharide transport periplasmic protein LptA n=1 Tax=Candidatus Blochmannia ocreatus (nom. nud.) TaxID=251538 RepID=A0ABY4SUP8_9ENTR|nr:lipopolysaccharide transport periplasmic protein LptA [Candidatus Blochmannia ocreatus]URJ25134.1 lipopolysaccharide transport periplasmic protein LptA [Candidatus Blochmannia ocreatus]